MVEMAREMKSLPKDELKAIVDSFDNKANLNESIRLMMEHLEREATSTLEETE
jgi:phosphopantothenate synthetase